MKRSYLFALLATVATVSASASELDPVSAAPGGLLVRENAAGVTEVFKADAAADVKTDAAAAAVARKAATAANLVERVVQGTELDQVSSDEAWQSWYDSSYNWSCSNRSYYGSNYYTYSYPTYYSGYNTYYTSHHYYPTYSWSGNSSRYTYYYPRSTSTYHHHHHTRHYY